MHILFELLDNKFVLEYRDGELYNVLVAPAGKKASEEIDNLVEIHKEAFPEDDVEVKLLDS